MSASQLLEPLSACAEFPPQITEMHFLSAMPSSNSLVQQHTKHQRERSGDIDGAATTAMDVFAPYMLPRYPTLLDGVTVMLMRGAILFFDEESAFTSSSNPPCLPIASDGIGPAAPALPPSDRPAKRQRTLDQAHHDTTDDDVDDSTDKPGGAAPQADEEQSCYDSDEYGAAYSPDKEDLDSASVVTVSDDADDADDCGCVVDDEYDEDTAPAFTHVCYWLNGIAFVAPYEPIHAFLDGDHLLSMLARRYENTEAIRLMHSQRCVQAFRREIVSLVAAPVVHDGVQAPARAFAPTDVYLHVPLQDSGREFYFLPTVLNFILRQAASPQQYLARYPIESTAAHVKTLVYLHALPSQGKDAAFLDLIQDYYFFGRCFRSPLVLINGDSFLDTARNTYAAGQLRCADTDRILPTHAWVALPPPHEKSWTLVRSTNPSATSNPYGSAGGRGNPRTKRNPQYTGAAYEGVELMICDYLWVQLVLHIQNGIAAPVITVSDDLRTYSQAFRSFPVKFLPNSALMPNGATVPWSLACHMLATQYTPKCILPPPCVSDSPYAGDSDASGSRFFSYRFFTMSKLVQVPRGTPFRPACESYTVTRRVRTPQHTTYYEIKGLRYNIVYRSDEEARLQAQYHAANAMQKRSQSATTLMRANAADEAMRRSRENTRWFML